MSPLRRVFHRVLWLLAWVLIPLAVVVGLGRELVPLVAGQKSAIERVLSEQTGIAIRLGHVEASWHSLTPSLVASDITLADPQAPTTVLLRIPRLTTAPDWWASLRDLSPRLRSEIDGLALTLAPSASGGIRVVELSGLGSSQPQRAEDSLRWLVAQPHLALTNSALTWQSADQVRQSIQDLTISQYSRGNDYRAQVQFRLAGKPDIQRGIIRVDGDPIAWQRAPWQLYLHIQHLQDWQPWMALLPSGWQVDLQAGDGELWLSGTGSQPQQATLAVQALSLRARWPQGNPYRINDLHGVFMAQGEVAQGRLAFSDVRGRLDNLAIPMQRGHVSWQPDALTVALAGLSITDAYALAKREALIPSGLATTLRQLNPTGFMPRVQIQAIRRDDQWALRSANAEFKALSWQAHNAVPGVSNMAGWLQASDSQGLLYLDSRRASIHAPEVFREAIAADTLRGGVRWYRQQTQWHIDTDVLALDNADAKARVQLALQLPIDDPGAGRLELLAGLHDGQVASAWRYVPWHAAGDKTLAWLRRALISGQVTQGGFVYSGALRRSQADAGRLDMALSMTDATLDYVPQWPALRELDAQLAISGRALTISATRARIMDAQVSRIEATIPELQASVLSVDADVALDLSDLDQLLAQSPLKAKTGEVAQQLSLRGPANAQLQLRIPFSRDQPHVRVDAVLSQASVGLADSAVQFNAVDGQVGFDLSTGLNAELTGTLWDEPAAITLSAGTRAGQWRSQGIEVKAPMSAKALSRWADTDLSAYLDGRAPVSVAVDIPVSRAGAIDLRVNSSLKGMALTLPSPLGKPAAQVAELSYQGKIGAGKQLARARIDGIASAGFHWHDKQLKRLLVRVGLPGVAWSEQAGVSIEAAVDDVQLSDWRAFAASAPAKTSRNRLAQALPAFQRLSLQTKTLRAGETNLGPVVLNLTRDNAEWLLNASGVQPAALPAWPATRVEARIKPLAAGWQIAPLKLSQANADFSGKLSWRNGARASSQLSGQIETRSTSMLLRQLGLGDGLESKHGQMTLDLSWPNDPMSFALAQASGSVSAEFASGRLTDIERINPLARVFGLVNASNLMRRLRFDFSDVTRKGLSFDALSLSGELNRGLLSPANIDLEGPSLRLRGRGSVNVLTHEVDQRLRVDIPVSSAAAVAGFLAGPVVGGALVAADLLLEKQLARLTSVRYHLTGPWDDLRINDEALLTPEPATSKAEKPQAKKPKE